MHNVGFIIARDPVSISHVVKIILNWLEWCVINFHICSFTKDKYPFLAAVEVLNFWQNNSNTSHYSSLGELVKCWTLCLMYNMQHVYPLCIYHIWCMKPTCDLYKHTQSYWKLTTVLSGASTIDCMQCNYDLHNGWILFRWEHWRLVEYRQIEDHYWWIESSRRNPAIIISIWSNDMPRYAAPKAVWQTWWKLVMMKGCVK